MSIYTTFFAGGPNFAYSKENIVAFYRTYLAYLEHWRQVLSPNQLYEIDYESLVLDKETVTRHVIDFLGLSWDEACLHHEQNKEQVSTPSRWQARQPIYSSSIAKWKKYEPWLEEFAELK